MSPQIDKDSLVSALSEDAIREIVAEEERLSREHARRAEGWRLILQGRRYLSGDVEAAVVEDTTNGRPTNFDAVMRVVASDPARIWTPGEIMNGLAERGWTFSGVTPRKTLGATLSILTKQGKLQREDRGLYRLPLSAGGDS